MIKAQKSDQWTTAARIQNDIAIICSIAYWSVLNLQLLLATTALAAAVSLVLSFSILRFKPIKDRIWYAAITFGAFTPFAILSETGVIDEHVLEAVISIFLISTSIATLTNVRAVLRARNSDQYSIVWMTIRLPGRFCVLGIGIILSQTLVIAAIIIELLIWIPFCCIVWKFRNTEAGQRSPARRNLLAHK